MGVSWTWWSEWSNRSDCISDPVAGAGVDVEAFDPPVPSRSLRQTLALEVGVALSSS